MSCFSPVPELYSLPIRVPVAKQQLSEDALDAGFEHAYSASSLSSANPVLGRYRTYCRSENIRPFPIVPAVIALYLSTTDFDTKRLGWELGFLQKAQSLTLPIWTGEEGDGLASGFLRDDPDVLAVRRSLPGSQGVGTHFPYAHERFAFCLLIPQASTVAHKPPLPANPAKRKSAPSVAAKGRLSHVCLPPGP